MLRRGRGGRQRRRRVHPGAVDLVGDLVRLGHEGAVVQATLAVLRRSVAVVVDGIPLRVVAADLRPVEEASVGRADEGRTLGAGRTRCRVVHQELDHEEAIGPIPAVRRDTHVVGAVVVAVAGCITLSRRTLTRRIAVVIIVRQADLRSATDPPSALVTGRTRAAVVAGRAVRIRCCTAVGFLVARVRTAAVSRDERETRVPCMHGARSVAARVEAVAVEPVVARRAVVGVDAALHRIARVVGACVAVVAVLRGS